MVKKIVTLNDFSNVLSSKLCLDVAHDPKTVLSCVLIIIYADRLCFEGDDDCSDNDYNNKHTLKILMTIKSANLKVHAGEVAFPGGKVDQLDSDLLATALRETKEELGITILRSQVVGQLEPVVTLNSNFTIVPFVCILDNVQDTTTTTATATAANTRNNNNTKRNTINIIKHNVDEVQTVLEIPLIPLLQTIQNDPDPAHNLIEEMYIFTFQKHVIWGATARILKQIVDKVSKQ